jgi:hypothetical protein
MLITRFVHSRKIIKDSEIKKFIWEYTEDEKIRDSMYDIIKEILSSEYFIRGDDAYYMKSI